MFSLKNYINPYYAAVMTSQRRLLFTRWMSEIKRKVLKKPHNITLYYSVSDPYSHVIAQLIPQLLKEFKLNLTIIVVPPCNNIDNPIHLNYALNDCKQLSQRNQLMDMNEAMLPSSNVTTLAHQILLSNHMKQPITLLNEVSQAVWSNDIEYLTRVASEVIPLTTSQISHQLEINLAKLTRQGHYQSAMLHYAGEWYWSIDRIAWLVRRLQTLGLNDKPSLLLNIDKHTPYPPLTNLPTIPTVIDCYFSFRSPYSYIAVMRLYALCKDTNITVNIKPVLPMVMRGLPVPLAKKMYILYDSARVAHHYDIPFGKVCDPLGSGILHCINIFYYAQQHDKSQEFITKTMIGIWSQGLDINNDQQLKNHVQAMGLDWTKAQQFIDDNKGQKLAEQNRQSLMTLGLWGVPSFHGYKCDMEQRSNDNNDIENKIFWGQDRLNTLLHVLNKW